MGKISLKINGTISRICERCGEVKKCNSFEIDGKNHLMCSKCTFEQYKTQKQTTEMDFFAYSKICDKCNLRTMRINKDKTTINDTEVIQYFECDKCGHSTIKKINKWRREKDENKPNGTK